MSDFEKDKADGLKVNLSWFHFFKAMIHDGKWAEMSAPAKALYPVIKAFTDPVNGFTAPNYQNLAKYSGLASRTSISRAIKELEDMGQIVRTETPGKTTRYKCREQFRIIDGTGNEVATSDFDYISRFIKAATEELAHKVKSDISNTQELNFINIKNIVINVAGDVVNGDVEKTVIADFIGENR